MNDLPAPLVPPEADLRDFAFMPLDVVRLRDSAFTAASAAEEFRSAILLWCASWHQLPAGSLPCDDMQLSLLAGFGRTVSEWSKHKAGALRHWQECSDGRLYHPVVAEKVKESWASKLRQRWRTECARIRKNNWRLKLDDPIPELDEWLSKKCPMRQIGDVTCDNMPMSRSGPRDNRSTSYDQNCDVTCDNTHMSRSGPRDNRSMSHRSPANIASKGQGEGQGQGQGKRKRYKETSSLRSDGKKNCSPCSPGGGFAAPPDLSRKRKIIRKINHLLPDDWQPTEADRDYAVTKQLSPEQFESSLEAMRLWAKANGTLKADWSATLKGFIRRDSLNPQTLPRAGPSGRGSGTRGFLANVGKMIEAESGKHEPQIGAQKSSDGGFGEIISGVPTRRG